MIQICYVSYFYFIRNTTGLCVCVCKSQGIYARQLCVRYALVLYLFSYTQSIPNTNSAITNKMKKKVEKMKSFFGNKILFTSCVLTTSTDELQTYSAGKPLFNKPKSL